MPKPSFTLDQYYAECIHMLEQQPGDYHIGPAARALIAQCHKDDRSVASAVGYIRRGFDLSYRLAAEYDDWDIYAEERAERKFGC
jgi:hypothetical protein